MLNAIPSLKYRIFRRTFSWIATRVPNRLVYATSLALGRLFGLYFQRRNSMPWCRDGYGSAKLANMCLGEFTQLGKAFEFPLVVRGIDQVAAAYAQHGRLLLCSIHLPLNRCLHRALLPLGAPTAVIADAGNAIWPYVHGIPNAPRPKVMSPGASLYFQVRSALSDGCIVMVDIDRWCRQQTIGLTICPIQFACRTQTPVLFFATCWDATHRVEVVFSPACASEVLQDSTKCLDALDSFLRPYVGDQYQFCWERRERNRRAA
jgi:hypothetical protein